LILSNARPVASKDELLKATRENPAFVEIETPAGFSPYYKGSLDKLPVGGTFFAKQGKVVASFSRQAGVVQVS
jgi:hypothetical protein